MRYGRSILVTFGLVTLLGASIADAQSSWRVDVGGGVAFPVAPSAVADVWNPGFHLAGAVRMRAHPRLLVGPEVSYTRFGFDHDAFEATLEESAPSVNVSGNELGALAVLLDAEYALIEWGNTRPIARLGVGWTDVSTTRGSASGPNAESVVFPSIDESGLSARVGIGVRTLLQPALTLVVDASWQIVWVDPDPVQFVPLRLSLRF